MRKTYFPPAFTAKYQKFLGAEWDDFFTAIKKKQPKSFWVNTNITPIPAALEKLAAKNIPFAPLGFHPNAFSIEHSAPGHLEEYQSGLISIQEKASMFPAVVLAPKEGDKVFDTCAAPGMKTIQLSNFAGKTGSVLATEVNSTRFDTLQKVKRRFTLDNVTCKRIDFRNIKRNKRFDKVLLDAPCSSEGLIRKQREALVDWSPSLVTKKAEEQKKFITKAFDYVKEKGGEMVYSTCSFGVEENEEVVKHLLAERKDAVVLPVKLPEIKIRKNDLCENCVRFYPQDNDTQQFFLAKIRRE